MNIKQQLISSINSIIDSEDYYDIFNSENIHSIASSEITLTEIISLKNTLFYIKNLHIINSVILTTLITFVIDLENFLSLKSLGHSTLGVKYSDSLRKLQDNFKKNFHLSFLQFEISNILMSLSNDSFFVGGAVRDACSGLKPSDIDFCTNVDINSLIIVFEKHGFRCKIGRFQSLLFLSKKNNMNQKENFEISILKQNDIFIDAASRDFTINQGYVRISDGKLLDPTGDFCNDLIENKLTFGSNAIEKLTADPVRCLRFIRFSSKGFIPFNEDLKLVRRHWNRCLSKLNPEIIRLEFEKSNGLI